jgi:enediyne biosynthesis protein E7
MHTSAQAATATTAAAGFSLGDSDSIWFKLMPLLKDTGDPMQTLVRLSAKYNGIIPLNMKDERVIFLGEPEHFKHVLVSKEANYIKYFDGLKPIFGQSMITIDGALWQKIRVPQQAAFHPGMFEEYLPFLLKSLRSKADRWAGLAKSGETIEMVEETWTLAADMVCQALFDREMPFNPHFVFGMVKAYTNVMNHKAIRTKKQEEGAGVDLSDEKAHKAMYEWGSVPDQVMGAGVLDHRSKTLLTMLKAAEADPAFPEFDHVQVVDEMKQYLWAGTETTALTLAWCLYLLTQHPEVAAKVREEAFAVCGDGEPTWEQAQNLNYTRMVIQETMRLYPPIWGLIRRCAKDDEIDGTKINAGDVVVLGAYIAHHNAKYWEDPEAFIPERFSPDRMKSRAKYSYLPFGGGKRACIGGALSQLENALALAMLYRRFEPEYLGEVPARVQPTVTLTPKSLPFRIRERG